MIGVREEMGNMMKERGVGRGVGRWCGGDWGLVYMDEFMDMVESRNFLMPTRRYWCRVEMTCECFVQDV
ncbi:hypothetical protein, partial [Paenibacillus xylanexedens]|uniref:hypothetical protein n=1 Tax=Paenibacillus xylanexedens TaxID=528191 RepID=UPI001C930399